MEPSGAAREGSAGGRRCGREQYSKKKTSTTIVRRR